MKRFVLTCGLLAFSASLATAGPIITVTEGTTGGGLDLFTFNLDADGEVYSAVDVNIQLTSGTLNDPESTAIFALPSEQSGFIGIGTITGGYSLVSLDGQPTSLTGVFTTLGGPPTNTFSGPLVQVTSGGQIGGTATFKFATAAGEIPEFETVFIFDPTPPPFNVDPPGPIDMQEEFESFSTFLLTINDANLVALDGITGSVFTATQVGDNIELGIDYAAVSALPNNTAVSETLTVIVNGAPFQWTVIATVPEPSTALMFGLAALGLVSYMRRK